MLEMYELVEFLIKVNKIKNILSSIWLWQTKRAAMFAITLFTGKVAIVNKAGAAP